MRRSLLVSSIALGLFVACTTTKEVHIPVTYEAGAPDASKPVTRPTGDDDDTTADDDDDTKQDAGPDLLEPTGKTSVEVILNDVKRTLVRAQFGFNEDGTIRIEAHEGGDPACPEQGSPSPKRTLIIDHLESGVPGTKRTKADGATTALIDFANDQLPQDKPASAATKVTLEIVAVKGKTEIEVEVDGTFAEGTAKGRVFAEHCDSLDE